MKWLKETKSGGKSLRTHPSLNKAEASEQRGPAAELHTERAPSWTCREKEEQASINARCLQGKVVRRTSSSALKGNKTHKHTHASSTPSLNDVLTLWNINKSLKKRPPARDKEGDLSLCVGELFSCGPIYAGYEEKLRASVQVLSKAPTGCEDGKRRIKGETALRRGREKPGSNRDVRSSEQRLRTKQGRLYKERLAVIELVINPLKLKLRADLVSQCH
ncbi:hypothetical protein Q8A73_014860 [Channa argus]|nr:hypothetical protein Q8A73_014860 [Channa argus]